VGLWDGANELSLLIREKQEARRKETNRGIISGKKILGYRDVHKRPRPVSASAVKNSLGQLPTLGNTGREAGLLEHEDRIIKHELIWMSPVRFDNFAKPAPPLALVSFGEVHVGDLELLVDLVQVPAWYEPVISGRVTTACLSVRGCKFQNDLSTHRIAVISGHLAREAGTPARAKMCFASGWEALMCRDQSVKEEHRDKVGMLAHERTHERHDDSL
jgi:hypothetical protein